MIVVWGCEEVGICLRHPLLFLILDKMTWQIGDSKLFENNGLVLRVTKVEDRQHQNLSTQNVVFKVKLEAPLEITLVEINIYFFKELLETIYNSVTEDLRSSRYAQINIKIADLKKKFIR